jgi:hypothetical protein
MGIEVDKLFDYIKFFFENHKDYHKLNDSQKAKHQFMLNRFMARKYPIAANRLNLNGINAAAVSDSWHLIARQYNRVPSWIFAKTAKSKNNIKKELDKNLLREYCNIHKLSTKDVENLKLFYFDDLKKELKALEKQINTK